MKKLFLIFVICAGLVIPAFAADLPKGSDYANDYAKANKQTIGNDKEVINLAQDAIKKFEKSWRGKRGFTIAAMIFLTGYIMSFIPKLYTLASGGINPGGKAIYAEAEKREGK